MYDVGSRAVLTLLFKRLYTSLLLRPQLPGASCHEKSKNLRRHAVTGGALLPREATMPDQQKDHKVPYEGGLGCRSACKI